MEKSGQKPSVGIRSTESISHEPTPELSDGTGARVLMDSRLGVVNSACSVVLNKLKLEDEHDDLEKEKKEDGEKEELRRSAKPSTSRIPTFQSSASRRRPISQGLDTSTPVLVRGDTSSLPVQHRGKASGGAEVPRTNMPGGKDTALPLPLTHLSIGDQAYSSPSNQNPGESLPHTGPEEPLGCPLEAPLHSHKATFSSGRDSPSLSDSTQEYGLPVLTPRPAIRAESDPSDPEVLAASVLEFSGEMEAKVGGLPFDEVEEPVESQALVGIAARSSEHLQEEEQRAVDEDGGWGKNRNRPTFNSGSIENDSDSRDAARIMGHREGNVSAKDQGLMRRLEESGDVTELPKPTEVSPKEGSKRRQASAKSIREPSLLKAQLPSSGRSRAPPLSRKCGVCSCLTLSTLLLLCGFGLHLWRYGTPGSLANLLAQVDLEWLETLWGSRPPCSSDCSFTLVESIPEGMEPGSPVLPPISQSWLDLLSKANDTVSIAAFYFTLRASDVGPEEASALQGEQVFEKLVELQSRGVKLQVAVSGPQSFAQDTDDFARTGAEVRVVDLQSATGGILHTKLWAVDEKHLYVGSANMDWRSLTQVKELAAVVQNCSCLVEDASRLFGVYWYIGAQAGAPLPAFWPRRYSALTSLQHPLLVKLNGIPAHVYFSSAPPPLEASGRTDDLHAILSIISDAQEFVYVSVMNYMPFTEFTQPARYWPAIDSALRDVACSRGVQVRLLVSCWPHSRTTMFVFLESLAVLHQAPLSCPIQVKVFEVPSTTAQLRIPFARVNHAKYMVTDRVAYIGTSNWSENYFSHTAGVGLVVNQTGFGAGSDQKTVQSQLEEVFMRDWTSGYSHPLSRDHVRRCGKQA